MSMSQQQFEREFKNISKSLNSIDKSETAIKNVIAKQLDLDKKLNKLIDDQNTINTRIFKLLDTMNKNACEESKHQSIRFRIDIVFTILTLVVALASLLYQLVF